MTAMFVYFQAALGWLHIVPWGMFKLMKHIKEKHGNPPMIITENVKWLKRILVLIADKSFSLEKFTRIRGVQMAGMDDANNPFSRLENDLQDDKRIQYHNDCSLMLKFSLC
jgi:beta-glucosidase